MSRVQRQYLAYILALTAIIFYYLATTLPHEIFGAWLNNILLSRFDRPAYESLWLGLALACFVTYLITLFKGDHHPPLLLLTWCFILTLISWQVIFLTNIEMIHLIQYALMAYILGFVVKDHHVILIWSTLLGAIDEGYQYLILAPETSLYFDFNDVLINILGTGYGLIYLQTRQKHQPNRFLIRITWAILLFFGAAITFYYFNGGWCVQNPSCAIVLLKKPIEGFWQEVPPGLSFHQMPPLEGILTCLLTLISFHYLLSRRK